MNQTYLRIVAPTWVTALFGRIYMFCFNKLDFTADDLRAIEKVMEEQIHFLHERVIACSWHAGVSASQGVCLQIWFK